MIYACNSPFTLNSSQHGSGDLIDSVPCYGDFVTSSLLTEPGGLEEGLRGFYKKEMAGMDINSEMSNQSLHLMASSQVLASLTSTRENFYTAMRIQMLVVKAAAIHLWQQYKQQLDYNVA